MSKAKNKTNNTKPHTTDSKPKGRRSTIVRKASDNLDHMTIVSDYAKGELSVADLAKKHGTSEENIGLIATRFWKSLTNMKEARALIPAAGTGNHFQAAQALKELENTELINKSFIGLLSDPDTALLSDAESIYAWSYVHSGDPLESLRTAGLDVGLYKETTRPTRYSTDQALKYRSMYLNAKPNVVSYIKQLREQRLIDADVGRSKIQSELIEQLESLKASPNIGRHRTAILRTIELLGKTVGAFVDRVEVTEVNPSNALDKLIEMAQEAEASDVTDSTEVTQ